MDLDFDIVVDKTAVTRQVHMHARDAHARALPYSGAWPIAPSLSAAAAPVTSVHAGAV